MPRSAWGRQWKSLPESEPLAAALLVGLPIIVPEADASRRKQFDDWYYRATKQALDVRLEVGGWQTILGFVASGLGVGLVPASAVELFQERNRSKMTIRSLDSAQFPPDSLRLVTRKAHGCEQPDLTAPGKAIVTLMREEAQRAAN